MTLDRHDVSRYATIAVLVAAIAVADHVSGIGFGVWVFYFLPLALAFFASRPWFPVGLSIVLVTLLFGSYWLGKDELDETLLFSVQVRRLAAAMTFVMLAFIGRTFIISRLKNAREDWFKAVQTGLLSRMQGEPTLEQLGEKILSFLAERLQANVGAIYLAERSGTFRRFGGYALEPSAAGPEVLRAGEGLGGQVIRDNNLVHLRDVPAKYLDVRSALGGHSPSELVIAPAATDERVLAVLELGFLHPVETEALEVFSRIGEGIASAVRSAHYRMRQAELLEETQRQAEELQVQQEELKTQNEELEQQSRALQASQARLENQQSELEQINSELEEHTQALEHQRDNLQRTQAELQRASAYKSEFLANMSHELRTPLNSSLILAKILADNKDGNLSSEQVKFAQAIYSSGNELLTLINDILDLSKIEAGKLDVRPESVVVARVVDDLLTSFKHVAEQKHLEFTTHVADGVPVGILTDPTRLQQILKNLLSNAIKFTERGGVWLSVFRAPNGKIAFEVKDTGIGIPSEQHEIIFEAFRQADGTTNRKYGGTGLGLSICRDLTTLLGGELKLDSGLGRGSVFTLLLPEQIPTQRAERAARPEAGLGSRPKFAPPAAPARTTPSAPSIPDDRDQVGPGIRSILIIEDDPNFAFLLADLARELEFKVIVAGTAEEAFELVDRYRPTAIVLDVGLPDRSGLTVLDALKHNGSTRHIPVHVVSASDYRQVALKLGATGYAIKPVQREQLLEALRLLEFKATQQLRRVLIVEDDVAHREATGLLLQSNDVETVAVGNAADALEQLQQSTFDCMVLDLALPDRTGFDLLEEMSLQEEYSFPPVIVYTGRALSGDEEQRLRRLSHSIIIKGARSPERLLDEVTLFLHQVESELPPERQRMLRDVRHREAVFEGRKVLIVEDDVRNIFALSSVLEPKGANIAIARNGREALQALEKDPEVDLVLMDIMMPEMNGLDAMREIRKQAALSKVPIIALTAKAMADDREQCLEAGANDYIAKPVDVDKLLSLARVWMAK